ncbi:LOW QUALITY PROTEIN: uncharacterized protein LOC119507694 [Choloepus didactylus]|uniref:LOW QUALITY PROTEIN: uncharacterized protein LOC119507694 n=1 Tax=Choloepus didactylus TaxID=27675 RepID=UPI00189DB685|nr:LOW QUALITY PROTEIN: uncharacterized protein LOC119507694 [Choloepus didactylus]
MVRAVARGRGVAPGGVRVRAAPARQGSKKRDKLGRVTARQSAEKRRRNWAQRAAARPRASCGSGFPEGGGAAAPPAVLGKTKVAWQWEQEARKEEGRELEGLPAVGNPSELCSPLHRRPPGTRTRPSPAEWGGVGFCVRSTYDAPGRGSGAGTRVVTQSANPPDSLVVRNRRRAWNGTVLLTQTCEGKSARRGARLLSRGPRAHRGRLCKSKFKLSLRETLLRRRSAASQGDSEKPGVGEPASGRRNGRPGWERGWPAGWPARVRQGVPGRARPWRLRGKFSRRREGVAPWARADQVRQGWARPGRLQKSLEGTPGWMDRVGGAASGQSLNWGRRAEPRWSKWRGAGRSEWGTACYPGATRLYRVWALRAVSVSPGDREAGSGKAGTGKLAPGRQGAVLLGLRRSAIPVPSLSHAL